MKANRLLFATGVISAATMLMPGQARAALDDNLDAGTVAFGIFLLVVAIIYELPAIIAFLRGHPNRWLILVLCTALGGTGIVWLGCLIWAFMAVHISKDPGGVQWRRVWTQSCRQPCSTGSDREPFRHPTVNCSASAP